MESYLVDISPEQREAEACCRLLRLPFIYGGIFEPLGLHPCLSWYVLRILEHRLVESFHGEIDILAGRLNWNDPQEFEALVAEYRRDNPNWHPSRHYELAALEFASSGAIKWPPSLDYLVAVEAKLAYYDPETDKVKSQKSSPKELKKIQAKIRNLVKMGFNRVALLDLIANPPSPGADMQAWLAASGVAWDSERQMLPILKGRLPRKSPSGHFVLSIASVAGGNETRRGAGYPAELQRAIENPYLHYPHIQRCRIEMERNLHLLLESSPLPRSFPAIFQCE